MKRWAGIFVPVLLLGSLIGWRLEQKRADMEGQSAMRAMRMNAPPLVTLAPVQVRDVTHTFEGTGTVEAPLSVKIAPKVAGRVDYLELREGDRVKKGQVLVRIDPSEVEANVQQAAASLAETQYRLAQAQLSQGPANVSLTTQLRQQTAAVSSASADYSQAKANYDAQLAAAAANVVDAQARIDNAKAIVKSAEVNLENATTRYNRAKALLEKGYVSAQSVEDAKGDLSVQQANLDVAQGQLNSAIAQKDVVRHQANIVKAKGEADIEAARARLEQAKASLEYAKANTAQKPAYEQSLAALKASVAAARAALRSAEAKRRDTVLKSPLDGFVTGRYVDPGAMSASGQPILAVQFVKQIWFTTSVPEEICARIHIGQPARVALDAYPHRSFSGSIIQVNQAAEVQTRQFTVRVIMSNDEDLLKPGMSGHAYIETDRVRGAVVVPREAIQRDRSGPYVFGVDSSNKAKRQSVTTGAEDTSYVAIEQGVSPGDRVVVMSSFPVRDGQVVSTGGGRPGRGRPGGRGPR